MLCSGAGGEQTPSRVMGGTYHHADNTWLYWYFPFCGWSRNRGAKLSGGWLWQCSRSLFRRGCSVADEKSWLIERQSVLFVMMRLESWPVVGNGI